jgi:hypothetical protein
MDLYKKEYLYINGSSISAGGGFEEYKYRKDVRVAYMDKGIQLPKSQIECTYGFHIAEYFNLKLINDAKSGSGIDRLIRSTFDWILNNQDKVDNTLFIFEIQSGIRLDWYVNEWKNYGVLNAHLSSEGKYPFTLVKDWFKDNSTEQIEWNEKYKSHIDGYFNNFFDLNVKFENELKSLIQFISYLNSKNIEYIISLPEHGINETYKDELNSLIPPSSSLKNLFIDNGGSIWEYGRNKKLLISDEVDNSDNHLGYNGAKLIAKKIINFIKKPFKIKVFTPCNFISESTHIFFTNSKFNLIKSEIEDCDLILLDNLDKVVIDDDFFKNLEIYKKYKDIDKFKQVNFLWIYSHEVYHADVLEEKLNIIKKELDIDKSRIFLIDASLTDIRIINQIPFEFKLKQFNFIKKDYDYTNFKSKKITYLNNKVPVSRFYVFDKVLHLYKDIDKFRNENIVSFRDNNNWKDYLNFKNLYHSSEYFFNLNLPWILDEGDVTFFPLEKMFKNILNYHNNSVFSLITETETDPYMQQIYYSDVQYFYPNFMRLQFSEKILLGIASGSLIFVVCDKMYYRMYEDVGFDFGYIKDIFGIDYNSNSFFENYEELDKFILFIKNKNINELNEIRIKYYHYIEKNLKVMKKIMNGDFSKKEFNFINKLLGRNENNSLY